jgi:hypothetical protein
MYCAAEAAVPGICKASINSNLICGRTPGSRGARAQTGDPSRSGGRWLPASPATVLDSSVGHSDCNELIELVGRVGEVPAVQGLASEYSEFQRVSAVGCAAKGATARWELEGKSIVGYAARGATARRGLGVGARELEML